MLVNPVNFEKSQFPMDSFWVFGYGSLMWDPGFQYVESTRARIFGFHRSLCIQSIRYRGTDSKPGLVFGLDRGGSCNGIAFRVDSSIQNEVIEYLWDREMLHEIYEPRMQKIFLQDSRQVNAITFVVKRDHPSYVKNLTADQTASIVADASGQRGANIDYVLSTLGMLESIGVKDKSLSFVGQLAISRTQRELQTLYSIYDASNTNECCRSPNRLVCKSSSPSLLNGSIPKKR